jgi:hypothetical protein
MIKPIGKINLDMQPQDIEEGEVTFRKNMLLTNKLLANKNELGFFQLNYQSTLKNFSPVELNISTTDYSPIGEIPLEEDQVICFFVQTNNTVNYSVIALYDNLTQIFTPICKRTDLNFSIEYPITGIYYKNFENQIISVFTDNYNTPKFINLNILTNTTPLEDIQLFTSSSLAIFNTPTIKTGGTLSGGTYYFLTNYINNDGTTTNWGNITPPTYIFANSTVGAATGFQIGLQLSNIDTNYDFVQVAVIYYSGGILKFSDIIFKQSTLASAFNFIFYNSSQSLGNIDITNLLVPYTTYTKIKTLTQLNNQLYGGNVSGISDLDFQKYANGIKVTFTVGAIQPAQSTSWVEQNPTTYSLPLKSLCHDEVYALYVAFELIDGTMSNAYHIPGRAVMNYNSLLNLFNNNNSGIGISLTNNYLENDTIANLKNDPYFGSTTGLFDHDLLINSQANIFQTRDTINYSAGNYYCSYWENQSTIYPDNNEMDVWGIIGGVETNLSQLPSSNPNYVPSLRNKKVRHHKMPSHSWVKNNNFQLQSNYGVTLLDQITLNFSNIQIPQRLQSVVKGIRFFYAERDYNNSTVLDQGIYNFLKYPGNSASSGNLSNTLISSGGSWNIYSITNKNAQSNGYGLNDGAVNSSNGDSWYQETAQNIYEKAIKARFFSILSDNPNINSIYISNQYCIGPKPNPSNNSLWYSLDNGASLDNQNLINVEGSCGNAGLCTPNNLSGNVNERKLQALFQNSNVTGSLPLYYDQNIKSVYTQDTLNEAQVSGGSKTITNSRTYDWSYTNAGIFLNIQNTIRDNLFTPFMVNEVNGNFTPAPNLNYFTFNQLNNTGSPTPLPDDSILTGARNVVTFLKKDSSNAASVNCCANPVYYSDYGQKNEYMMASAIYAYAKRYIQDMYPTYTTLATSQLVGFDSIFILNNSNFNASSSFSTSGEGDMFLSTDSFVSYAQRFYNARASGDAGNLYLACLYSYIGEFTKNPDFRIPDPGNSSGGNYVYPNPVGSGNDPNIITGSSALSVGLNDAINLNFLYDLSHSAINNIISVSAFNPYSPVVSKYPYRVIVSNVQVATSNSTSYKQFLATNYYECIRNKGEIINIQSLGNDRILIHHKDSVYYTRDIGRILTGVVESTIGTGNIFEFPPQELMTSSLGYGGTQNQLGCLLTDFGYFFIDAEQGTPFLLQGEQLTPLINGLRLFFRDNLNIIPNVTTNPYNTDNPYMGNGISVSYDRVNRRILLSVKNGEYNSYVLSYTPDNNYWVSFHDYTGGKMFNTRVNNYSWYNNNLFLHNANQPGLFYDQTTTYPSIIDIVINTINGEGKYAQKLLENISWQTEVVDGGSISELNNTFNQIRIQTNTQLSDNINIVFLTNTRLRNGRWQFNAFRDLVNRGSFSNPSQELTYGVLEDFNTTPGTINTNLPIFQQRRFQNSFFIVRLIFNNSIASGDNLYLYDVDANLKQITY